MALYRKINPTGIDTQIDLLQNRMYTYLSDLWSNFESYPRVYKNIKKDSKQRTYIVPEFAETNKEYKEVLFNDNYNCLSFWLKSDETDSDEVMNLSTSVSVVFSCDLNKLYPNIPHRADEEMKSDIIKAFKKYPSHFTLTRISDGVDNAYKEFETSKVVFSNIAPRHVVRFDFDINYKYEC